MAHRYDIFPPNPDFDLNGKPIASCGCGRWKDDRTPINVCPNAGIFSCIFSLITTILNKCTLNTPEPKSLKGFLIHLWPALRSFPSRSMRKLSTNMEAIPVETAVICRSQLELSSPNAALTYSSLSVK